jgi:glycosyltransferase involved in cell wall biosynthesis
MRILFVTGVFENDATGAARFAKLVYQKGGPSFTILSEDTNGGDRIIKMEDRPTILQSKLWQYFRIAHYRRILYKYYDEFDVFLFNNSLLAYGFESSKPCYSFVHDEKLMKVKPTLRFDFFRKHIFKRLEKRVIESGIKVISNSKYITKRILDNYKIDSTKISLLYQGINLADKQKAYNNERTDEKVKILFIKNDYLIGGLLELFEALKLLNQYTFEITIIGPANLNLKSLKYNGNLSVTNKGILSNEHVVTCMYNHDLLCIPARFEPLGVAVMEGLAVGIPTITTGVGGLPEVTQNGQHVWQCEPNNPESIKTQIIACLSNKELRESKSKSGREYIHQKFDIAQVIKNLDKILRD